MDLVVGRIGRPHGVRGEVGVEVRTDDPTERFAIGTELRTDPSSAGPLTVAAARPHSGRLLVRFEQVRDRNAAEALRGVLLTVQVPDREEPADPEELYDHQLVGLQVHDHAGTVVGEVADVLHNPAHDLLVVRRKSGGDVLVPFVSELVPDVDLGRGRLTVADRPGLLEPEQMD
ncbi:MAG TPA: ribosome maturation factor RimM [Nocardioidaceae bacterium]|nr:ribosome maturation factor RimM [Nocardioidaceae bacterium]